MRRWLLSFIFVLFGFFLFIQPVYADENFATQLNTTYTVENSGVTTIEHHLTFTNKSPTLYVKQYALKVSSPQELSQITVISNGQTLTPNIVSSDHYTSIAVSFPDKVVGEGQKREVIIRYSSPDFSTITGKVLEVNVPALASDTHYDEYNVTLVTPKTFQAPSRVSPQPTAIEATDTTLITRFNNLGNKAVSALFGTHQIFQFSLRYTLENPSDRAAYAQIALPPDTAYQRINLTSLEPLPSQLTLDANHNWLATYQLAPNQTLPVMAIGQARLSLMPDPAVPLALPDSTATAAQQYWEIDNSNVAALATKYTTPRQIYDFVVEHLTYPEITSTDNLTRLGASATINQPDQATCQEFTDLFIALARANGIPARRMSGYAYSQNASLRPLSLVADILHAWPEYYDHNKQQWIPVDPTWANTTGGVNYFDQFDLNHLVFAINSTSSTLPFPAGSYKTANQDTKDVDVQFGHEFPEPILNMEFHLHPVTFLGLNVPGKYVIEANNLTGMAWYDTEIRVTPADSDMSSNLRSNKLGTLLPFDRKRIELQLSHHNWWQLASTQLRIELRVPNHNNQDEVLSIPFIVDATAGPIFTNYFFDATSLAGLGIGGSLLALITGSLLVLRRRQKRVVRRKSQKPPQPTPELPSA